MKKKGSNLRTINNEQTSKEKKLNNVWKVQILRKNGSMNFSEKRHELLMDKFKQIAS